MNSNTSFRIASFGGDGIGPEVMRSAHAVLEAVSGSEFQLEFANLDGGAGLYRDTGTALPDESFAAARIDRAVEQVIASGKVRPTDLGGSDGTDAITDAVIAAL